MRKALQRAEVVDKEQSWESGLEIIVYDIS